eukprot:1148859-Pelagomonas_calceolata.AAC.13
MGPLTSHLEAWLLSICGHPAESNPLSKAVHIMHCICIHSSFCGGKENQIRKRKQTGPKAPQVTSTTTLLYILISIIDYNFLAYLTASIASFMPDYKRQKVEADAALARNNAR